ncbi:MAG: CHAP domain-containing protein, partial [Corynebacterium sp.]|nr:CHAP domain-containing protein [Corynebacterium sp.]
MGKNSQRRTVRRIIAVAASLALVTQQAHVASATPKGKNLCREKNSYGCLSFSGYGERTGTWADTWYPGNKGNHNCTRYVAYRLAKGGTKDYGVAWGHASQWLHRAPGVKDKTATVGAVAYWSEQWTATHWGHSWGHVAIVEKVNIDGSIEVTWDSQNDGTVVRQIIYRGEDMPSYFIHIDDSSVRRSGGVIITGDSSTRIEKPPSEPNKPGEPSTPHTPGTPPSQPNTPGTPGTPPSQPNTPGTPSTPATTTPERPGTPSTPATTTPDRPGTPSTPETTPP